MKPVVAEAAVETAVTVAAVGMAVGTTDAAAVGTTVGIGRRRNDSSNNNADGYKRPGMLNYEKQLT